MATQFWADALGQFITIGEKSGCVALPRLHEVMNMNAEQLSEWFRRQGHKVYRTKSSYWFDAGPGVFQAFPYHRLISPSKREINALMLRHGIVGVRYSSPLGTPGGRISYHVLARRPYELGLLKSQARNGVKNGLKHFTIGQIAFERLATEGWLLQQDTLARQGRLRSMNQNRWERLCRSANGLPGFEAWAASSNGELAAALIVCRMEDFFYVPYSLSHTRFLTNHPNNALFYAVTSNLLAREGVQAVFFTVQSLDAPANVDEFKFRMGLKPEPICQCIDFSPVLRPFAKPRLHSVVQKLLRRYPSSSGFAKAEGMLRFYLEASRPFDEQEWPDCVAAEREERFTSGLPSPHLSRNAMRDVEEVG
jgi:hypothetical protein